MPARHVQFHQTNLSDAPTPCLGSTGYLRLDGRWSIDTCHRKAVEYAERHAMVLPHATCYTIRNSRTEFDLTLPRHRVNGWR